MRLSKVHLLLCAAFWGYPAFCADTFPDQVTPTEARVQAPDSPSVQTLLPSAPTNADVSAPRPWQLIGGLAYVGILGIGAVYGVRYLKNRKTKLAFGGGTADAIRVLSTRRVGLTTTVHVLEVKGKTIVMATHGANVELLQLNESDET